MSEVRKEYRPGGQSACLYWSPICSTCLGESFNVRFIVGEWALADIRCSQCGTAWTTEIGAQVRYAGGNKAVAGGEDEPQHMVSKAKGKKKFDRVSYQREFMRKWRAKRRKS